MMRRLSDEEVGLIKAMLASPGNNDQRILSYFTRPGRDVNHTVIGDIRKGKSGGHISAASENEVSEFKMLHNLTVADRVALQFQTGNGPAIQVGYRFLPVGQGLFATGSLTSGAARTFNWVYDCGTVGDQTKLSDAVKWYRTKDHPGTTDFPQIDLLTISHFDNDHISGMELLLQSFSVDTLLLPYVLPWKRLELILLSGLAASSPFVRFMIDPVAYIREIEDARVERIVFVPPGQEPDDTLLDEALPPTIAPDLPRYFDKWQLSLELGTYSPEQDDDELSEVSLGGTTGTEMLAPGTSINVNSVWEFFPYNIDTYELIFDKPFRARVRGLAQKFLDHPTQTNLEEIKQAYDNQIRISGKKNVRDHRNPISLHLYSGPIGKVSSTGLIVCRHELKKRNHSYTRVASHDPNCIGQMLTGDGTLKKRAFAKFEAVFQLNQRLLKISVHQVAHHGAQANWHKGLAAKLAPLVSVFSADDTKFNPRGPHASHVHPHISVWDEFQPFGAVRVNSRFACSISTVFRPLGTAHGSRGVFHQES